MAWVHSVGFDREDREAQIIDLSVCWNAALLHHFLNSKMKHEVNILIHLAAFPNTYFLFSFLLGF